MPPIREASCTSMPGVALVAERENGGNEFTADLGGHVLVLDRAQESPHPR